MAAVQGAFKNKLLDDARGARARKPCGEFSQ
jgi:hypothetical protein